MIPRGRSVPYYVFQSLDSYPELLHAVTTRRGGVSAGHFASLNLGHTVGDAPEAVEENHRRLAEELGIPKDFFVSPRQVHGNHVAIVTKASRGSVVPDTDALITNHRMVPLLLRFADCTPILVYDPRRHAIGLGHAGWRGTVARMAEALVRAMSEAFGSDPADMIAAVGPAIGPCCYEVGPEVVSRVEQELGPEFLSNRKADGHAYFDLWAANERQLRDAGVGKVEVAGVCTACHRDEFFSHRGDHGRTGRFGVVMMLR